MYSPAAQLVHVPSAGRHVHELPWLEDLPAAHLSHSVLSALEYLPAAQSVHVPPWLEDLPAAHLSHSVLSALDVLPAAQLMQK